MLIKAQKKCIKEKAGDINQRTVIRLGDVQDGSFRAEKIEKEHSNDNFEHVVSRDFVTFVELDTSTQP